MRVKILGLYWNLRFESLGRFRSEGHYVDGLCDPANTKNRSILIEQSLSGEKQLEAILHEALHACDQCKGAAFVHSEEYVTAKAKDLSKLLWRLGYRRNAS